MVAVVQRVSGAQVMVDGAVVGRIDKGLCVLVAVHQADTDAAADWMAKKLASLRIFPQDDKNYHLDVRQVDGAMLLISNFTVAAITHRGRRPTLDQAADPELGKDLFDALVNYTRAQGVRVETGVFRAHMDVRIDNDGPTTFIVDSRAD